MVVQRTTIVAAYLLAALLSIATAGQEIPVYFDTPCTCENNQGKIGGKRKRSDPRYRIRLRSSKVSNPSTHEALARLLVESRFL
jgi:hypothetical protein